MRFSLAVGLASALSLATFASAATCVPTSSWCFGSNPEQVSNGTTYSITGDPGAGSISVFGEQITNSSSGGTYLSSSDSTISGLFSTNTTDYNEGTGIAPYNPVEGTTSHFSDQDGITDEVTTGYNHLGTPITNSNIGNILVLELGSNIADGTTLSFLLQAGNGEAGDAVTLYSLDATGTNPSVDMSPSLMTNDGTTPANSITNTGTTPQFTITKDTSGIEFIAIEADCHYLLLDSITPGTSSVPEPRFYGLLLAGLLGLAGMVYQKRRAAQANG
ncbi:MAG: hypothetical protein WBE37_11450 [Bryobacteraceae bacterium]